MNGSLKRLKLGFWIETAEKIAQEKFDGHLTIMRSTTHWKAMFGPLYLDSGDGRGQVRNLPFYPSLEMALKAIIISALEEEK
jgi:hypothetical protein